MKITKIKILKSKVVIYIDKRKIELDKEVYPNFYLYEGKEVTSSELKKIKEENDLSAFLKYALNIRSKKLYSEYEMREKLYSRGAKKADVDKIIKKLKTFDLIDDRAFISEHIAYYNSLNYGENKIKEKLLSKGIFSESLEI